jgi:hypothetical protein
MGRTEKSQGLAPPAVRKDMRAKQARAIVKKVVPALLASNARARKGAEGSELIVEPGAVGDSEKGREGKEKKEREKDKNKNKEEVYVKRKGQGKRKAKGGDIADDDNEEMSEGPKKGKGKRRDSFEKDMAHLSLSPSQPPQPQPPRRTRIITTDTLTAAHILSSPHRAAKPSTKPPQNPCILNMASPLRPGGGILAGATSQEEFLCARTTLLPSLKDAFYRLPELGGIWTRDVLVFRRPGSLAASANEMPAAERYWVDVVSAGMLRFPDLEGGEDEVKRLSARDARFVEAKMRAVLRIVEAKGVRRLVLGAWGCGAYGNPVADVARAWRRVLDGEAAGAARAGSAKAGGGKGMRETWPLLSDVVFAISSPKMADDFARAFGGGIEVEAGPGRADEEDEEEEDDGEAEDLKGKIRGLQEQIGMVWNPDLKARLGTVLEGLQAQLKEREGGGGGSDSDDVEEDEDDNEDGDEEDENEDDDNESDAEDADPNDLSSVSSSPRSLGHQDSRS